MKSFTINEKLRKSRMRWSTGFFAISSVFFIIGMGILTFLIEDQTNHSLTAIFMWTLVFIYIGLLAMSVVMLRRVFRFKKAQELVVIYNEGLKVSGLPLVHWSRMLGVIISDTSNEPRDEGFIRRNVRKVLMNSGMSFVSLIFAVDDIALLQDHKYKPAAVDKGSGNVGIVTLALDVMLDKHQLRELKGEIIKITSKEDLGTRIITTSGGVVQPVIEMSHGMQLEVLYKGPNND